LEAAGGGRVSLSGLAGALVSELKEVCARAHDALAPKLLEELARRDVLRDREVVSQQLGVGVARGIAADGALLLERADGRRVRVVAGSVRIR
jgi:biotin-(acetyl-CoA carboxylase) ligase